MQPVTRQKDLQSTSCTGSIEDTFVIDCPSRGSRFAKHFEGSNKIVVSNLPIFQDFPREINHLCF